MADRLEDLYSPEFKKKLPAYREKFEKQRREREKRVTEASNRRAFELLDRIKAQQPDAVSVEDVADNFRERYTEYRLAKTNSEKDDTKD